MPQTRSCPTGYILWQAESPISRGITGSASGTAIATVIASRSQSVDQDTEFTAVAAVEHIDLVVVHLVADLNGVATMRPNQVVI